MSNYLCLVRLVPLSLIDSPSTEAPGSGDSGEGDHRIPEIITTSFCSEDFKNIKYNIYIQDGLEERYCVIIKWSHNVCVSFLWQLPESHEEETVSGQT